MNLSKTSHVFLRVDKTLFSLPLMGNGNYDAVFEIATFKAFLEWMLYLTL